jgi:hypothetical protein
MPSNFHHVSLTFGVTGQVLEFYPGQSEILFDGAPTAAATYAVYRGTTGLDGTAEFSGTATLDAVSTTVDAASGYGQANRTKLYVTATTSMAVGGRYLVTNALGQREIVTVSSITAADYVEVEEPLGYDYASGATVKGLRHYFTVDATFIADTSSINMLGNSPDLDGASDTATSSPPWRIVWAYTTGSTPRRTITSFDVARAPFHPEVTFSEIREMYPDLIHHEWVDTRGQDYSGQLRAAERDLRIRIRAAGYDPNQIQDPEIHQQLLRQLWAVTIGKGLLVNKPEIAPWLQLAIEDFEKSFNGTINSTLRAWVSTSSGGAVTPEPARQLWLRSR